jgi:hypothetical protein
MKKLDNVLKNWVERLTLDNLKLLQPRLEERLGGDLGEALELISSTPEIDRWLQSAANANDFYDMLDTLSEYVTRELRKRVPELVQI